MIDSLIYTRLHDDTAISAIVDNRITPYEPTVNSAFPAIYYFLLGKEKAGYLKLEQPGLRQYTYAFDVLSPDCDLVGTLLEAIDDNFSTWQTNNVRGCFLDSTVKVQEDTFFHGQSVYRIWYRS